MQDRPAHLEHPPGRGGSSAKKILLGVIIGVIVLGVGCLGVGTVLFLRFSAQVAEGIPGELLVTFDYPETVKPGETFTIKVSIDNTAAEAHTLDSIDVNDELMAGIRIQSSTPGWRQSMHIFDFTSYDYQFEIPGNDTTFVTFTAKALLPGDYMGDVDICVNNEMSCASHVLRTIVSETPAEAAPDVP